MMSSSLIHSSSQRRNIGVIVRRSTALAAAVATALGVLSPPAALAQASADEIQALKDQVQQLQRQIDRIQAQQAAAQQAAQQAPPPPPPGTVPPAQTSLENHAPFFYAGPIKLTPNGFVELMTVTRNRNEADDWASNFNTGIPYPNSHNYYLSEFHETERQSRVAIMAEGPDADRVAARAYLETDFGGSTTNGNNNQSTSFGPRVRHFFADLRDKETGWYLLFGQTWSLVTAERVGVEARNENIPPTIDGQYVPGFSWLRVPQIRIAKTFGDVFGIAFSAENPAAQVAANTTSGAPALNSFYNTAGASNAFSGNITTDSTPDFVLKAALDPGWGHYEVFGVERTFQSRYTAKAMQSTESTSGGGGGANVLLPLLPWVDFQAGFLGGKGIGRYGSAGLPDVTVRPVDGSLQPIDGYQTLVGIVTRPTTMLTVYAFAGIEHDDSLYYDVVSGGKTYAYGYGSPLFDNSGCETEGGSACAANTSNIRSLTLGGWWKFYQGTMGNAQVGLSDTYIQREIYSGVGGDPATNINIALLSFRYYPYQK
jgi:hypothetical protein